MIVFKIMLIILVSLPVIAIACALFVQVASYVRKLNARDKKRSDYIRRVMEGDDDD